MLKHFRVELDQGCGSVEVGFGCVREELGDAFSSSDWEEEPLVFIDTIAMLFESGVAVGSSPPAAAFSCCRVAVRHQHCYQGSELVGELVNNDVLRLPLGAGHRE